MGGTAVKETLLVVGAGQMGSGIAHLAAQSGLSVHLTDQDMTQVERGLGRIRQFTARDVDKGRLTADQAADVLKRIEPVWDIAQGAKGVSFAIEAVVERVDVKQAVFSALDAHLESDAVIATNTSSISITQLATSVRDPSRVVGMHFFNPPVVMKLVEVIRGLGSSDQAVRRAKDLAAKMGRTAIEVKKDSPGFVVNRILMPFLAEAVKVYSEGLASAEDIDTAVRLGLNHPMGPLTLLDFTGIDVCLDVMDYFHRELGQGEYAPPIEMRRLVRAGRLGKKARAGFFDYPEVP